MLDSRDRTFDNNLEFQFADQDAVAGLQNRLALNPLTVHERPVRTPQVANADAEIVQRKHAVVPAH